MLRKRFGRGFSMVQAGVLMALIAVGYHIGPMVQLDHGPRHDLAGLSTAAQESPLRRVAVAGAELGAPHGAILVIIGRKHARPAWIDGLF